MRRSRSTHLPRTATSRHRHIERLGHTYSPVRYLDDLLAGPGNAGASGHTSHTYRGDPIGANVSASYVMISVNGQADSWLKLVSEGEGTWGFLELAYGFGLSDRVLTALSAESRVWMVTWHFNGGYTVLHAADGEIRAWMRDFIFTEHRVENGDPSILAGFRTMLDALDPEDYRGKRGAAFAFIEAATGMCLDSELPDVENTPVVILDNPAA